MSFGAQHSVSAPDATPEKYYRQQAATPMGMARLGRFSAFEKTPADAEGAQADAGASCHRHQARCMAAAAPADAHISLLSRILAARHDGP